MSTIWIVYERKLVPIQKSHLIRQIINDAFNLKNFNFRLRNSRGNLIPVNRLIETNLKNEPYKLEIYDPCQSNKKRTSISNDSKQLIQMYIERVIRMEKILTKGNEYWESRCREILPRKLDQIESQLCFIEKRFNLIDTCKWIGSLKKPLLW